MQQVNTKNISGMQSWEDQELWRIVWSWTA